MHLIHITNAFTLKKMKNSRDKRSVAARCIKIKPWVRDVGVYMFMYIYVYHVLLRVSSSLNLHFSSTAYLNITVLASGLLW